MSTPRLLVAGGGPVGLALAAAVHGFEVRVVEAAPRRPPPATDAFDLRIYALSPGSRGFLRDLGAWEQLDAARLTAVRRMEVFGDAGARLAFGGPAGAPLAWIAEAGRLTAALEAAVRAMPQVEVTEGAAVAAAGASAAGSWVELEGGRRFEADLLVGADGPDSRIRTLLGIEAREASYRETALVANFEAERVHGGTARQWFRPDGVLAWLPLPGSRISIVWSAPEAQAERLAAMEPAEFAACVRDAGGAALGDLRLVSAVGRFPLRITRVPDPVAEGVALVGDAAHAVHPLAGQGVNLGFQDARGLAETLAARSPLERPGDLRLLRRHARARREDVGAMQFVTDRLDWLFGADLPGAALVRNAGLRWVQGQPWIKGLLASRAMR